MSKPVINKGGENHFMFRCPGCNEPHAFNATGWTFNGDLVKPTISPSLLIHAPNHPDILRCHSFVTDGRIQFLSDSEHELAGQTVDLPEWTPYGNWKD